MKKQKITTFEYGVLLFAAIIVAIGIISSLINITWFEQVYVVEDGFVENLTLLPLLGIAIVGVFYLRNLGKLKSLWFRIIVCLTVLFSIFVAGEEISWGQRIFNVNSSEFFQEHNAQSETNLHNLVIGGKKVNKIVFSQLLILFMAFYLLVLPVLYKKKEKWRSLVNYLGIPVPQLYQVIAAIVLFACISIIPSGKNAEILEVGITYTFFLIYTFPRNVHAFRKNPLRD